MSSNGYSITAFLHLVQQKWSSDDPKDTIPGYLGKIVVEGGIFTFVAVFLLALGYAIDSYLLQWGIITTPKALASAFAGFEVLLFGGGFCKIIRNTSQEE
ncbi:hypothetical protein [Haladaptatus sp. CMSO5]|uniref:hypothetical protein n=1 Tax=Haladaptatus sp. CMSO5 TaxID=3120514 RepID=UPI002FCDEA73